MLHLSPSLMPQEEKPVHKGPRDIRGYTIEKGLYKARITFEGKTRHIGCFKTAEEAQQAFSKEYFKVHGHYPTLVKDHEDG